MKVVEALAALTPPYNHEALTNADVDKLEEEVQTVHEAVHYAFTWRDTPQGYDYWDKKHKALKKLHV